jgi:hypothetical protein
MLESLCKWTQEKLIWNGIFSFIMSQFPTIIISSGINLYELDFKAKYKAARIFSSGFSLVLLSASLVSLPILWIIIKRGMVNNKEEFKKKCGALIEEQRAYNSRIAAYWKLLNLIRWTLTAVILIFLRDYNQFQIVTLLILSILFSCFIAGARPFEESIKNKMSLITESIVSIYLYILMCLTDFME